MPSFLSYATKRLGFPNPLERFVIELPLYFWIQRLIDLPILLKWAHLPKRASILEVGCGTGRVASYLSPKLKCKSYMATDMDPQMVAKSENQTRNDSKIICQMANICKLPFKDESFDAVIEMDVLHHVPNWRKGVKEINRVLKKDGKFLMRDLSIETFTLPGIGFILRQLLDYPYDDMYDQIELLTYLRKNNFMVTHHSDSSWLMMLCATKQLNSKHPTSQKSNKTKRVSGPRK